MPSPVLNREPRTLARSHPGPKYRVRHSAFASNPPDASTTARARTSSALPFLRARTPFTPSSSWSRETALVSYCTSILCLSTAANNISTSPGPPPQASTARPPQNVNLPSTLNAWRPYMGTKRTPFERIQSRVSRLRLTRISTMSGSARYWVRRAMSSKNWSVV